MVENIFYVFPFIEIAFGLSIIIFFKSRVVAYFGLFFHASIVLFILFSNSNFIIISWNCFYIVLWFLMIYTFSFKNFPFFRNWKFILILSLFSFLPIFNFYDKYDDYFSFSLYSGKIPLIFLIFPNDAELPISFNGCTVSNDTAMRVLNTKSDDVVVSYYKYCIKEINVPPVINDDTILKLKEYYSIKFEGSKVIIFHY